MTTAAPGRRERTKAANRAAILAAALAVFGELATTRPACATSSAAPASRLDRDPPDVEGATRFATELFLGGMARVAENPR